MSVSVCVIGMLVMYSVLYPTHQTPSHCVRVKETMKSLYDSESGMKTMAIEHHLGVLSEATTCFQERGS